MNPHGIRAWLPPVYGPKRRYEAPTCVRSPRVYADTMTALQVGVALRGLIDPKHIVSGWMPRRVHVTDDDGNVVREMTAEQLGAKLIARASIEFLVDGEAIPSTLCPKCGKPKRARSKECHSCFTTAAVVSVVCSGTGCMVRVARGRRLCNMCLRSERRAQARAPHYGPEDPSD